LGERGGRTGNESTAHWEFRKLAKKMFDQIKSGEGEHADPPVAADYVAPERERWQKPVY